MYPTESLLCGEPTLWVRQVHVHYKLLINDNNYSFHGRNLAKGTYCWLPCCRSTCPDSFINLSISCSGSKGQFYIKPLFVLSKNLKCRRV